MISSQTSKENLPQESSSRKRKWDHPAREVAQHPERTRGMNQLFDSHLHSKTPFSPDWQRCFDIKSEKIHYHDTRNKARESCNPAPMSLELELNLPFQPLEINQAEESYRRKESGTASIFSSNPFKNSNSIDSVKGLSRSPSWLTFEDDQQEMLTAVCKKCYMLVMMCKSSPACPNCKFMHPIDSTPELFDKCLSLLC